MLFRSTLTFEGNLINEGAIELDIKGPSKYLNLKFDEIKERITAPGNRNNRVKYIDSIIVFLELLEMILWV